MRARSREYDQAIRSGATLLAEAVVLVPGEEPRRLPVLGGSYTVDYHAAVLRRASFTIGAADPADFVPSTDWRDDRVGLWPIGNEVLLRCGAMTVNGPELFDCGLYRISAPTATRPVDGGVAVTVNLYDRARTVSRNRVTEPLSMARKDLTVDQAIIQLLGLVAPWLGPDDFAGIQPVPYVVPGIVIGLTDDPWKAAQDLATGVGCTLYFDGSGKPVMRPVRDIADIDFSYGPSDGVLLGGSRALDDASAYSGVIMVGDNSDLPGPLWAEAWDRNPDSPTYYDPDHPERSKYGRVPANLTSSTILNSEQAQLAADAALRSLGGVLETVAIEGLVNHAHEAEDILAVKLPDIGVDAVYVLDTITAPLTPDSSMALGCRARSVR